MLACVVLAWVVSAAAVCHSGMQGMDPCMDICAQDPFNCEGSCKAATIAGCGGATCQAVAGMGGEFGCFCTHGEGTCVDLNKPPPGSPAPSPTMDHSQHQHPTPPPSPSPTMDHSQHQPTPPPSPTMDHSQHQHPTPPPSPTMDHSQHNTVPTTDHSQHGGGQAGGHGMPTYFQDSNTLHGPLLFEGWVLDTSGKYFGAWVVLYLTAILGQLVTGAVRAIPKDVYETSDTVGTIFLYELMRAVVFGVGSAISLSLMLVAMLFNVGLFFAVVLGNITGFFIVSVYFKLKDRRERLYGTGGMNLQKSSHEVLLHSC